MTHRSNFRIKVHRIPIHASVLFGHIIQVDMRRLRVRTDSGGMDLEGLSSGLEILVDGGSEIVSVVDVLPEPLKSFRLPQKPKFEDARTTIREEIEDARVMPEAIVQFLVVELLGGCGRGEGFECSRLPCDQNGRVPHHGEAFVRIRVEGVRTGKSV